MVFISRTFFSFTVLFIFIYLRTFFYYYDAVSAFVSTRSRIVWAQLNFEPISYQTMTRDGCGDLHYITVGRLSCALQSLNYARNRYLTQEHYLMQHQQASSCQKVPPRRMFHTGKLHADTSTKASIQNGGRNFDGGCCGGCGYEEPPPWLCRHPGSLRPALGSAPRLRRLSSG